MRNSVIDYVKANRKQARKEELANENGFVSKNKVHKSKKEYNRAKNKVSLKDLADVD